MGQGIRGLEVEAGRTVLARTRYEWLGDNSPNVRMTQATKKSWSWERGQREQGKA